MRTVVTKLATFMFLLASSAAAAQTVLPIVNGGTGATTAPQALTNLGGAALSGATFTGPISAPSINNTCMADQQAGADMGAKIAACNTLLCSGVGAGIIDATGFHGMQYASVGFTVGPGLSTTSVGPPSCSVTLKLGYMTLIAGGEIKLSPQSSIVGQATSIFGGRVSGIFGNHSNLAVLDMTGCAHCLVENVTVGSYNTPNAAGTNPIPQTGITVARNPASICGANTFGNTAYACDAGNNTIRNVTATGFFQYTALYAVESELLTIDHFYGYVYASSYYSAYPNTPKYCMAISQTDYLGLGVYSASTMTMGEIRDSECWYYPAGVTNSAAIYFGGGSATNDWHFYDSYLYKSNLGAFIEINTNETDTVAPSGAGNMDAPLFFDNVDGESETLPNYAYYIHGAGANPMVSQLEITGGATMGASLSFINATANLNGAYINSTNYMTSGTVTSSFATVWNSTIILPFQKTTIVNALNSKLVGGANSGCGACGLTVSGTNTSEIDPAYTAGTSNTYYSPILVNPTVTGTLAAPNFNATTGTYQMAGANVLLYSGGVLYLEGANSINIGSPGSCYVAVYETSSTPMISECGLTSIGPMKASGSSAAVGYATGSGAGCVVTQGTSRTTGVTCTGNTGAITLYSAAGSTSYTTFTVTDSSVAATDTVQMNPSGGTNTYLVYPPTVASGSFKVTYNTTGGTSVDAPVFNFTVIKGSSN